MSADDSSSKAPGIRARNRAALEAEILTVATAELGRIGAAGLSLRAVAREMGMASSAIYRYVDSRDELLTRLIVAAFTSLGDHAERAFTTSKRRKPRARFRCVALAVREWALAHPNEWALIYGSPVPDYQAPDDRTTEIGTQVPLLFASIMADFSKVTLPVDETSGIEHIDPNSRDMQKGIASWTLIIGAISGEVFGHLGPGISDPAGLFDVMIDSALSIIAPGPS